MVGSNLEVGDMDTNGVCAAGGLRRAPVSKCEPRRNYAGSPCAECEAAQRLADIRIAAYARAIVQDQWSLPARMAPGLLAPRPCGRGRPRRAIGTQRAEPCAK